MCQVCSPLIPAWSRTPVSCPRSVSTKRRSSPTSGPKCSIRAPSGQPSRWTSRFAFCRPSHHYEPGTLVTREATGQHLKAVTVMRGLQLLTVDVPELEDLSGAAARVFGTLYEDRVEVVLVSQASSRRRMTYLIDGGASGGCDPVLDRLADSLQDFEAVVGCTPDVAIVAAVGHGAAEDPKALGQLLAALGRESVPVLASSQQTSNAALVAAIPSQFADRALQAVHNEFIRPLPESGRSRRRRRSDLMGEALRVG